MRTFLVLSILLLAAGCADKLAAERAAAAAPHLKAVDEALKANDFARAGAAAELAAAYEPLNPAMRDVTVRVALAQFAASAGLPQGDLATRLDYQAEAMAARDAANIHVYDTVRALVALSRNDAMRAEELARHALAKNESYAAASVVLGRALQARGERDKALEAFDKAVMQDPGSFVALANAGKLAQQAGKHKRAAELLDRAMRIQDSVQVRADLAQALLDAGEARGAAQHFSLVTGAQPGNADARLGLATSLLLLGELDKAEAAFAKASELGAEPYSTRGLGVVHFKRGAFDKARDRFAQALKIAPNDPTALFYAGQVAEALKNGTEATRFYAQYISIAANDTAEAQRVAQVKERLSALGVVQK